MKISFHKFPDDKGVFRQWIVAIRRDFQTREFALAILSHQITSVRLQVARKH